MAVFQWSVDVLVAADGLFLIVLVLIQRGKGGGLAGAFGGMGGQSAFGTKAGDLFTKITIGVAAFWIVLVHASPVGAAGHAAAAGSVGRDGRRRREASRARRPRPRPASSRRPRPSTRRRRKAPAKANS